MEGTTDGRAQTGKYDGARDGDGYSGTYTVDKGKQRITVSGCIPYDIASHGAFRLIQSKPASASAAGEYSTETPRVRIRTKDDKVSITPLDPKALYTVSIA